MRSSLELLKRTLTSWVGEIGETPKAPNGFFSKNTFFKNAGICIVLRLITGFKSPKHFAITVLTNSNSDFSYLLHKGIKKISKRGTHNFGPPLFWRKSASERVRVTFDRRPPSRATKTWLGRTLQHAPLRRYMRLCEKQLGLIVRALCVGQSPG